MFLSLLLAVTAPFRMAYLVPSTAFLHFAVSSGVISLRPSPGGIWKKVFVHLGLALLAQQNPKASGLTRLIAKWLGTREGSLLLVVEQLLLAVEQLGFRVVQLVFRVGILRFQVASGKGQILIACSDFEVKWRSDIAV